jgi:hypothetical protein
MIFVLKEFIFFSLSDLQNQPLRTLRALYNATQLVNCNYCYTLPEIKNGKLWHVTSCSGLRRLSPPRDAGWKPRDFVHP